MISTLVLRIGSFQILNFHTFERNLWFGKIFLYEFFTFHFSLFIFLFSVFCRELVELPYVRDCLSLNKSPLVPSSVTDTNQSKVDLNKKKSALRLVSEILDNLILKNSNNLCRHVKMLWVISDPLSNNAIFSNFLTDLRCR